LEAVSSSAVCSQAGLAVKVLVADWSQTGMAGAKKLGCDGGRLEGR
jgi:hypothetical protein